MSIMGIGYILVSWALWVAVAVLALVEAQRMGEAMSELMADDVDAAADSVILARKYNRWGNDLARFHAFISVVFIICSVIDLIG